MDEAARQRERMVSEQIEARGIRDANVLAAMRAVPRHAFLPDALAARAYADGSQPIACGQTISQPYIVALMAAALELGPTDRVLEVGSGCGYAAAVLARLAGEVYTVERHPELAKAAQRALEAQGCANVTVRCGDGSLGWPERAPFDAISVAAAGARIPPALEAQLAPGGRLVMPVGTSLPQDLVLLRRDAGGEIQRRSLAAVAFVPLIEEAQGT